MRLYDLGTVIAERQFDWTSESGGDRVVSVKIGMPQQLQPPFVTMVV
jgi:hypothetical protein